MRINNFARRFWVYRVETTGNSGDGVDVGSTSGGSSGSGDSGTSENGGVTNSGSATHFDSVDIPSESVDMEAAASRTTEPAKPAVEWEKLIPEDLKDKPYIKSILESEDPSKELFSQFSNLQKKLGERVDAIPKEGASEEEWNKFYAAMGRPETPDGYEFNPTEWSDEDKEIGKFIDSFRGNDGFLKDIKEAMFKRGLSKESANALAQDYDQIMVKHNKQFFQDAANAQAQWDKEYTEQMTEIFGSRAQQVQEIGRKILKENVPTEVKALIDTLEPRSLSILAAAMDGINKRYVKEDSYGGKGAMAGANEDSLRAEGQRLMALPAWQDVTHPDHDRVNEQVKNIYRSLPR